MPPSQDSSYTPRDLIAHGSWDHALFTTYALSPSFYETQLHKLGLARNGCRDIRIVADADGYQLSLSERQSQRVFSTPFYFSTSVGPSLKATRFFITTWTTATSPVRAWHTGSLPWIA